MRLYTFTIPTDAADSRLIPYARRMLPELPEYAIREAFEKRDVKMNGVRVGKDAQVIAGAEVRLYAREGRQRALIRKIYEDENLLVVIKPVGISCERDAKGGKTVTELAREMLCQSDSNAAEPLLCHRLDNQTDGLLVLAKNTWAQAMLQRAFRDRQIHKSYTCIVQGAPDPRHAVLRAFLLKDATHSRVRILPHEERGALSIVTEYTVMEAGECSRLNVTLHTGRTHQIRAHLAAIGHPLLGDDQYGDRAFNKRMKASRLMLCATTLSFSIEGEMSYLNEKKFTYRPEFSIGE